MQDFPCKIKKIFKNTYFDKHLGTTDCFSDLKNGIHVLCNSAADSEVSIKIKMMSLVLNVFK